MRVLPPPGRGRDALASTVWDELTATMHAAYDAGADSGQLLHTLEQALAARLREIDPDIEFQRRPSRRPPNPNKVGKLRRPWYWEDC